MNEQLTEKEQIMIQQIIAEDIEGLDLLVDLYGFTIVQTIRRVLNHPAENFYIEDVENEVIYKLWQKMKFFDASQSSLKTWISRIANYTAIDQKRKIIRELKIEPHETMPESPLEESYFQKDGFLELVASLKPEDQLIFLKYYYYQESPKSIARELQLSVEQIHNRLSRGRKKLRETLSQKAQ